MLLLDRIAPRSARGIVATLILAGPSVAVPQLDSTNDFEFIPSAGPVVVRGGMPLANSAPFRNLTDNFNEVANFNIETTRGMVIWGNNEELWAINTHGSTLNKFVGAAPEPLEKYPTLVNPVALALWEDNLLVVGAVTQALALHDRATGDIVACVQLDSEPFDLVVDEDNERAYVSCQGTDNVVVVDLVNMVVADRVDLLMERPGFLNLVTNDPLDPDDNEVWVAPEVSGNNTLVAGGPANAVILSGTNPTFFIQGLPDVDLVKIDCDSLAVTEMGTGIHTNGYMHGFHPSNGSYWQVGVDSHNEQFNSEPEAKGQFQDNVLNITNDYSTGTLPKAPDTTVVLDQVDSGLMGNPKSVSMPWGLTFEPSSGWAWISSSTGDLLAVVDDTGARQPALDVPLPEGSIPRQMILDATGTLLLIYCWGTNKIQVLSLQAGTFNQIVLTLNLGHDPHDPQVRAGREIFYDADNSQDDKLTCGSCHPGGMSDSLAWNIQDTPRDQKGVMVTQTLFGIFDNFPHHWRGERELEDFNDAFSGLLGGINLVETEGGEQDQFGAFVNSLTPHANPNIHVSRTIRNTADVLEDGSIGNAVAGDIVFHEIGSDGGGSATCVDCHSGPTSSSGDPVPEIGGLVSERTHIEIMQLDNQIELKDQPVVDITIFDGSVLPVQLLGSGWAHNGTIRSLLGFLQIFGPLTAQEQSDCTSFVKQFDTGTAPSVHVAHKLNSTTWSTNGALIREQLLAQAHNGWCGVIALGTTTHGGSARRLSWAYDTRTRRFLPDDPSVSPPQEFKFFNTQAQNGLADVLFMGTPPGNQLRLGIDYDNDGIRNGEEALLGTEIYVADTDGDGFEDGYEKLHGSDPKDPLDTPSESDGPVLVRATEDFTVANVSKWHFEFDEKTRPTFTFQTAGGQVWETRMEEFAKFHTVVFQHREASTLVGDPPTGTTNTFDISATLEDVSGNPTTITDFDQFIAETMLNGGTFLQVVSGDIAYSSVMPLGPDSLDLTVDARVDFKEFGPPATPAAAHVLIGQVLVKSPGGDWTIHSDVTYTGPTSFFWDNPNTMGLDPYVAQPGPWVVFPATDTGGLTSANFQVGSLSSGDEVMMNIKFIHPAPDSWVYPAPPEFPGGIPNLWDKPTTLPENRDVVTTF